MPLERRSSSDAVFLTIKNHTLWQEFKESREGCDSIKVTNPQTKQVMTKYGLTYNTVTGYVIELQRYKREHEGKMFTGCKLKFYDGEMTIFVDIPYKSIFFRKFSRLMHNIDFRKPLSISAWKDKQRTTKGQEQTAIWFFQGDRKKENSVPTYITKENNRGCPPGVKDPNDGEWDFRDQGKWLMNEIQEIIIPRVIEAAKFNPKPGELHIPAPPEVPEHLAAGTDGDDGPVNDFGGFGVPGIEDDDVPF